MILRIATIDHAAEHIGVDPRPPTKTRLATRDYGVGCGLQEKLVSAPWRSDPTRRRSGTGHGDRRRGLIAPGGLRANRRYR